MKDKHFGVSSKYDFFKHIIVMLKDLDPDRNGYVTNQELEDCFFQIYPEKLKNINLKKIFNKYASIQNKLLIDYKRVIKAIQYICQNKSYGVMDVDDKKILTKEDIRRQRIRPSDNIHQVMHVSNQNFFKYDPFKHGNSSKTFVEE